MTQQSEGAAFVAQHATRIAPLMRESNLAAWDAATSGLDADIRRSAEARTVVKRVYSDRDGFTKVRELLSRSGQEDPIETRQLVVLDHAFTANQLPPETIEDLAFREADLERIYYNFRAHLDGQEL